MDTWKNLGTVGGYIENVPYSAEWPDLFELEAKRIKSIGGGIIAVVEHIGSTAIPGMPAKPIIDIMPGLDSCEDGVKTIEPLQQLGYEYFGENGIPGRFYFGLRYEQRSVIHVHIYEIGTENWDRHLIFRDFLRTHPMVAMQYAELKKELAVRYRNNRKAYTDGKGEFINSIVDEALVSKKEQNA